MLLRLLLFIVLFHCDICGLRLWCFGLEVMKHRTCMRLTLEKNLLCLRFGFGKPVWVGFSSWRKPHHTVSWVWNCIAIAKSTWPKPILRTKQVHTLGKLDRRESAPPNQTKFLPNFTRNYFCGYSVSVAAVLQNYTGKVTVKYCVHSACLQIHMFLKVFQLLPLHWSFWYLHLTITTWGASGIKLPTLLDAQTSLYILIHQPCSVHSSSSHVAQ